jgi:hypothetical protein
MDFRLIRRLISDKLRDRTTYVVAAVVGTLISAYGQLLVPWIRSGLDPFETFAAEFERTPVLTILSVFLAYAFPFCVGIYSAVAVRYANRRMESIADFPDRKPDPVFHADRNGHLVEVGATTQDLFDKYHVDSAQKILGDELWAEILSKQSAGGGTAKVFFAPEAAEYLVSHAPTDNGEINLYLTRLTDHRGGNSTH